MSRTVSPTLTRSSSESEGIYGATTAIIRGVRVSELNPWAVLLLQGALLHADAAGTGCEMAMSFGANDSDRAGLTMGAGSTFRGTISD